MYFREENGIFPFVFSTLLLSCSHHFLITSLSFLFCSTFPFFLFYYLLFSYFVVVFCGKAHRTPLADNILLLENWAPEILCENFCMNWKRWDNLKMEAIFLSLALGRYYFKKQFWVFYGRVKISPINCGKTSGSSLWKTIQILESKVCLCRGLPCREEPCLLLPTCPVWWDSAGEEILQPAENGIWQKGGKLCS